MNRGPGIIQWLSDALTSSGSAAMVGGLLLVLPGEAVAAAIAAATAIFGGGGTAARAGEMAAKEMLKWMLEKKGLDPKHLVDLNDKFRTNFPGVDLISPNRPWQIKIYGIDSKKSKFRIAMDVANDMVELYGGKPWRPLPKTTAKALVEAFAEINQEGAWPISWPIDPTIDELKERIRDTAFAVPDDLISQVRGAFGKRLVEDPKLRELFPELRLGSLVAAKTLKGAAEREWAERVGKFLFSHVVGVGATTDQLRTMAAAAKEIATGP